MKLWMKLGLVLLAPLPAPAYAVDWGIAALRDVGRDEDGQNWIALDLKLNDGWKTYWQYAGQNGLDPEITITQEGEPVDFEVHWPEPHLFLTDDLPALGYKGDVLVPISLKADGKVDIAANIGVCETVCVPANVEFSFNSQPGYSVEQFVLQGKKTAPEAESCDWDEADLAALDPDAYWMFITDTGVIEREAPEDFETGRIYRLEEDRITPLECS